MPEAIEIRHCLTRNGRDVFEEWLSTLSDVRTQAKIAVRIDRLALGNFGDCKSLGNGLHELRIDWGPGYRVYFAMSGPSRAFLLCGGDKRTQIRDIGRAREYLSDYKTRTEKK